jgi:hypothetical protein
MEQVERPIIVPWDFTHVAENAFQHAVNISKSLHRDILLLHIVAEKREIEKKKDELNVSCEKLAKDFGKAVVFMPSGIRPKS